MSNHDREGSHPSNRDTPLERAWREASDEQPPARLDAAIFAAARQSVADRDQPPAALPPRRASRSWQTQWQPLAAAATVAGLAFVLVQMLPREHSVAPATQHLESAPVATAIEPVPQSSPALEATDNRQAPGVARSNGARERVDAAVDAPAQGAVPAPAAMPPTAEADAIVSDSAGQQVESSAERREVAAPEMAGRAVSAAAVAPTAKATTGERSLSDGASTNPTAWAADIAAQHAAGDLAGAADALRAFRATVPDADTYLPESLRSWAATVR